MGRIEELEREIEQIQNKLDSSKECDRSRLEKRRQEILDQFDQLIDKTYPEFSDTNEPAVNGRVFNDGPEG